jgi:hypothetical protein
VVDSTDEEKLLFAKDELRKLLQCGNTPAATSSTNTGSGSGSSRNTGEGLGDVPFLLLYNKRDLSEQAKTSEELSGRLEIDFYREQGRQLII